MNSGYILKGKSFYLLIDWMEEREKGHAKVFGFSN